jgi:DNA-directed RNA polymerase II subunit RPB2
MDKSVVYRNNEPAIVEKVIMAHTDDDVLIYKIKLRYLRNIRIGDKVASRAGNKSIICALVDAADMPYAEDGLVPDFIANPHTMPTRMVIGQILEGLLGLLAVKKGSVLDAITFHDIDVIKILEELRDVHGMTFGGYRRLFNGKTGNWLDTLIFTVPTGYNRIQKMVMDGYHALNNGPTLALTRQPLEGKSSNGGLRLGEMEFDAIMAHGSMRTLHEKIRNDSDGIDIYICRNCGRRGFVNKVEGIYSCGHCKDSANLSRVFSTWVANLLFNEMSAMNIEPRFELEKIKYSVMS